MCAPAVLMEEVWPRWGGVRVSLWHSLLKSHESAGAKLARTNFALPRGAVCPAAVSGHPDQALQGGLTAGPNQPVIQNWTRGWLPKLPGSCPALPGPCASTALSTSR